MTTEERTRLKLRTFMAVAHQIAELGTCDRKHVGAVIVKNGRCISWGFNGAPEGSPHCDENYHGWKTDGGVLAIRDYGCRNATHAEANALAFAARQGISTDGCTLFVTVSPCDTCARLLLAAGITTVYYDEEYRDRRGIETINGARAGSCLSLECSLGSGNSMRV